MLKNSTIPLAGNHGTLGTKPIVNANRISFNGVEDDSYETFQLTPETTDFEFCKTARRPYDPIVVEVLKIAKKHHPQLKLSSDGGQEVFQ